MSSGPEGYVLTKWFEGHPLFGRLFSNCISSELVDGVVKEWMQTLASLNTSGLKPIGVPTTELEGRVLPLPEKLVYLTTSTELEGRLVCATFGGRRLDVDLVHQLERIEQEKGRPSDSLEPPRVTSPHGFKIWPRELRIDPEDKSLLINPDMLVTRSTRLQQWISVHWLTPDVKFYNYFTKKYESIQVSIWDIKRWSFHGMMADSYRLECAREIAPHLVETTKRVSSAKYKTVSARSLEGDRGVWTVTEKKSGLHFAPNRQHIVADVPELRGFTLDRKEKPFLALPCNYCIDLTDEQNSAPQTPEQINEYVDRWLKSQTGKEKQWGSGPMRLSMPSRSKNHTLSSRATVSTPKGTKSSIPSPRPLQRSQSTLPFMDEESSPVGYMGTSGASSATASLHVKSPIVFQNYTSSSSSSSCASPSPSPSLRMYPSAPSTPVSMVEKRKMSTTNIRLRHMEPLARYKIACYKVEIRCVYHFWDITPLMVQKDKMKYPHHCAELWKEFGTYQHLEFEVELDLSDAAPFTNHQGKIACTEAMLQYFCIDILTLLSWGNVLIRELNRESRQQGYQSPWFAHCQLPPS